MPDGSDPVIHDMDETEWERRAFADKMAKRLGVPLNELKTVAPSRRDGIVFALHDGGYTVREIERYTGVSKSTVSRIVRAYARVNAQAEARNRKWPNHSCQAIRPTKFLRFGTNTTDYFVP